MYREKNGIGGGWTISKTVDLQRKGWEGSVSVGSLKKLDKDML